MSEYNFAEEIAKFIPSYPEVSDPKLSWEIFRREEFNSLQLETSEPVPDKPGIPLLSQELQARYFSPHTDFTSGLLYHGVGTGKTCTSSLIVEHFKNMDGQRRPALVIVPNENLERSYRREVALRCTDKDTYLPTFTDEEMKKISEGASLQMTDLTREKRLRAAIKKSYEIVTLETFLFKRTNEGGIQSVEPRHKNKEVTRSRYSNRVIIIDEAHNLRIQPPRTKKSSALSDLMNQAPGSSTEMYKEMWNFLHTVEDCRIILLTGTPIWDKVYEIASLMNLILPEDEQLPTKTKFYREFFDKKGILKPNKISILRDRFRGRVSYLRPMMTTAKRDEIGVKGPWLQHITVYPSAMSSFQYHYAKKAVEDVKVITIHQRKGGKILTKQREVKGGAVRILARDASTFVFPGGDYGSSAFKKHILSAKNRKSYRYKDNATSQAIRKNLSEYSSKFAAILQHITERSNELVFIYNEYVAAGGSGSINLGLILQAHGFVWVKRARDIARPDTQGRKRFAVITHDKATTHRAKDIEQLLTSFNKPDNMYGERCQIIIGSRKIGVGITIKNIRQVHIVMPHWNISAVDQALGRAFRVGSHNSLPKKDRYVNIYRHVAVKEYDDEDDKKEYNVGKGYPSSVGFSSEKTIDIDIYSIAEKKEFLNTQIYRLLKEISWDCPLTYRRNVLEGDHPGTRDCDYQDCNYRCDGFPLSHIGKHGAVWNYSAPQSDILQDTYNLFYSDHSMTTMIERIKELFGIYFNLRLDMIAQLIDVENEEENSLLLRALDYIINARIRIKNRYGFPNYLKEQGNIYFLDNAVSVFSNFPESTYIISPLVTERNSLEDIAEIVQLRDDSNLVKRFCKHPKKNIDLLRKVHYRTLILILETIYAISIRPQNELTSREKEAIEITKSIIQRYFVNTPSGIAVHNMYSSEYTGLGYNVAVQQIKPSGWLRVFDPADGIWGYIGMEEEEKYISTIKRAKKVIREETWEGNPYGVYGFIDRNGKFKIREKEKEGKRPTKGSVCMESSWDILRIYALFKDIGYLPPSIPKFKNVSREQLLKTVKAQRSLEIFAENLDERSDEELRQMLTLNSLYKKELCQLLEKWFRDNNLFYDYRT